MVVNSLKKIEVIDRQDVFITCIYDEHKKHLRIILLDENECKAFSGSATEIDLISQAATIRMIFTDFMHLTIKALTKNKCDNDKFLYCIEKNCEGFIFKWKSVDHEETIINIGSIKLTERDYKFLSKKVLLLMSEEVENLRDKLEIVQRDFADLKKDVDNSLKIISNATDVKERVENELYSKFVLVLNEKKKEIRNLKRKTVNAPVYENQKQTNSKKWKKLHHISDSSDESVNDSDNMDVAGASTSKGNNSLQFFDEAEPQLSVSPSKKRNRSQYIASKNHGSSTVKNHALVSKSSAKSPIQVESESEDELLNFL